MKKKTKGEFRYNYYTKHTNFVFEETENDYHALGLTHQRKTFDKKKKKWRKNMPLVKNPKNNSNENAFIRYGVISQNKKTFSNVDKRFKFRNKTDMLNVKSKIRNYKKNRKK